MQDILSQLSQLRRPRLLIRAARIASQDYRRATCLPRLLGYGHAPRSGPALIKLMSKEHEMNESRKTGDAFYSVADHVEVLTAIMGEQQLLRAQSEDRSPLSLT